MSEPTDAECERILQQMAAKMTDDAMAVLCGSDAFKKPQPTALRLTPSGGFEVVELRDDGSIIEPVRCTCHGLILHQPTCPFWALIT